MNTREVAAAYIARGWSPVPLVAGKKAPDFNGWTTYEFQPTDFRDTDNIGLKLVNGLTDIDCDCIEAVEVAYYFLPKTGVVSGRASRPNSHYFFRSDFSSEEKQNFVLHDEKRKVIVELRSGPQQTMVAPSLHPSGEQVAWVGTLGDPTYVEAPRLTYLVRLIGTCAMLRRHYPTEKGTRHQWGIEVAGFLRSQEVLEDDAIRMIEVAGASTDPDLNDRVNAVRSTYRLPADTPMSKKLHQVIGKEIADALVEIWGGLSKKLKSTQSALVEFNKTRGSIMIGGVHKILEEDGDTFSLVGIEHMRSFYNTQKVTVTGPNGAPKDVSIGSAYVDWPLRRIYRGIEMAPGSSARPGYYNLWKGFSVKPVEGNWRLIRQHIQDVICAADPVVYDFVMRWLARTVQEPDTPIRTAVLLQGGQGTGKSIFVANFGAIFGPHFKSLTNSRQLTGMFNAHLENAILVFADEALWAGDKSVIGTLRGMVTERTRLIERKGVDAIEVQNHIHLMMASNNERMIHVEGDERRFAVLRVSDERKGQDSYFRALAEEFASGGTAAMLYDLLKMDTGGVLRIPATAALGDQKRYSASPELKWWHEVLDEGRGCWNSRSKSKHAVESKRYEFSISVAELHEDYANYMKPLRYASARDRTDLVEFLRGVCPEGWPKLFRPHGKPQSLALPGLQDCRDAYSRRFNLDVKWNEDSVEQNDLEL